MSKDEIIHRLLNLADHSIYIPGVEPYIMSLDDGIALHEAVDLLKEQEPKRTFKNGIEKITCGVCGSVLSTTIHSIPD